MDATPTFTVTGVIRLGQFLKLTGLAPDGAAARELACSGDVLVNGQAETRRGRQLAHGDLVEVLLPHGRQRIRLACADEDVTEV